MNGAWKTSPLLGVLPLAMAVAIAWGASPVAARDTGGHQGHGAMQRHGAGAGWSRTGAAHTTAAASSNAAATSRAGVPWCRTSQLRGYIAGQNAGAGSIFTTIALRNVGRRACVLVGYPGVSLVDARHRQIGVPARWDGGTVRRIVLRPGGAASAMVRSLNPGTGTTSCYPPSAALRIYPPNERISLLIPAHLSECLHVLDVKPLVAGTAGM